MKLVVGTRPAQRELGTRADDHGEYSIVYHAHRISRQQNGLYTQESSGELGAIRSYSVTLVTPPPPSSACATKSARTSNHPPLLHLYECAGCSRSSAAGTPRLWNKGSHGSVSSERLKAAETIFDYSDVCLLRLYSREFDKYIP